ncbi:hypothetical protein FG386_002774 [Cryptosporidium ryanae]|uniref:uncharacterized protein n=1 Tax=Cryptosporidium ryanae TaxID=515981 RepID=UPI00351A7ED1|nr:hypothetical protein FG386_002774 [Cryptosporidium ryanae]
MISLSVSFKLLLLIVNLSSLNSSIINKEVSNKNETRLLNQITGSENTLYPVDASDLLECSKINGFILLDKTNELTSQDIVLNDKLTHLESLYLSSQFFGIIESISGTRGNFINDAISGIQITSIIDVLKDTKVEVYVGTINNQIQQGRKVSNINLSCLYSDYCPSLTNYDYNNLCEYITNPENKYMFVDEDKICSSKYISKNDIKIGKNMYFNIIASLNIPIINYKEVNHNLFPKLSQNDFYLNSQFNMDKYLLFSKELGISFTINFGFGLFSKLNAGEKYYMLMKMVPPKSFWIKDNYYATTENNIVINNNNNNNDNNIYIECSKYEKYNKLFGHNSYLFYLKGDNKRNSKLKLKGDSITYITILTRNMQCLNGYKLLFEAKDHGLIHILIYDNNLGFIKMTSGEEQGSNSDKYYHIIKNKLIVNRIQVIIMNGSSKDSYLSYNIKCNTYKVGFVNLLLSIIHSFHKNIKLEKAIYINSSSNEVKKYLNYKYKIRKNLINGLIIMTNIVVISIIILLIVISSNKKIKNNNEVNSILNTITNMIIKKKMVNDKNYGCNRSIYSKRVFNNYDIDDYSYSLITESNNEQNCYNVSLNSTSPVTFKSISNNQQCSPNQIDLYTAISNNIYDNIQHNTDYSLSPSTIKSITFKN